MKKLLLGLTALLSVQTAFSQDGGSGGFDKKFRFGLRIDPALCWYTPDNQKKFENGGMGVGFTWGLHTEFKLSDVVSFYIAPGMQYDRGKINYLPQGLSTADSTYYLINKDDEIIAFPNDSATFPAGNSIFRLKTRQFKGSYVNISTGLKMHTKEIGAMRYYGQFGLNIGIKVKVKANDEGDISTDGATYSSSTKEDVIINSELQPLKLGLNIGAGLEFNISGSTCMMAGLSYNHGFSNVITKESDYLRTTKDSNPFLLETISQKASARNLMLTIGIIF
ncbi:MAG: outer membrane beta-barrel protein [Bacteroidota bacterium]